MQNFDQVLLEQIYTNTVNTNDEMLFENSPAELAEALPTGVEGFLKAWGKYCGKAAIAGAITGIAASLFGWLIIGISKIIDKDAAEEQRLRQEFIKLRNKNKEEALMNSELTDDELYEEYKKIEGDLAQKLEESFPLKGSERWALILDKVGRVLVNKIGTGAFALAGLVSYFKIKDAPKYTKQPEPDYIKAPASPMLPGARMEIRNPKSPKWMA